MTLPTLRRIAALAEAGATIIGDAPIASPSLADDPAAFVALVGRLWRAGGETRIGRGRVVAGDLAAALPRLALAPDVALDTVADRAAILVQHRQLPDGHVYYLANTSGGAIRTRARFRVAGRAPEVWHADTGGREPISYEADGAATRVPLDLGPRESTFIVFRGRARGGGETIAPPIEHALAAVDGPWTLIFQPGRGAPARMTLPHLSPLDRSSDPAVRYFRASRPTRRD